VIAESLTLSRENYKKIHLFALGKQELPFVRFGEVLKLADVYLAAFLDENACFIYSSSCVNNIYVSQIVARDK